MERRDVNAAAHRDASGKNYQREREVRVRAKDEARGPITVLGASQR